MPTKTCTKCKEKKSVVSFGSHKGKRDGLQSHCTPCRVTRNRDYHGSMDDTELAVRRRRYFLKSKYGITLEEWDSLFEEQGGVCAICGEDETQNRRLAVDHCHTTGVVRGLLCQACNTGIGKLKDNPELLIRAAQYLDPMDN